MLRNRQMPLAACGAFAVRDFSWAVYHSGGLDSVPWTYVAVTAILVVTPGSTTAVVVRNTLAGGRAAGFGTALGAAIGNTSHAAAAGLGLSVLFSRSPSAILALKLCGAAYLAWLGGASLWRAIRAPDLHFAALDHDSGDGRQHRKHTNGRSFIEGLTVNLLNPAIVAFYVVIVPSFLPANASQIRFVAFAAIHVGLALACHGIWATALDLLRGFFRARSTRRAFDAAIGVTLVALAVRVVVGI